MSLTIELTQGSTLDVPVEVTDEADQRIDLSLYAVSAAVELRRSALRQSFPLDVVPVPGEIGLAALSVSASVTATMPAGSWRGSFRLTAGAHVEESEEFTLIVKQGVNHADQG